MTVRPFEQILSVADLKTTADRLDNYFFTPGAMKAFNSRISDEIYPVGNDNGYIVTSERFEDFHGNSDPRMYRVRKYSVSQFVRWSDARLCDRLSIDTVEEFGSAVEAHRRAEELQGFAMLDSEAF